MHGISISGVTAKVVGVKRIQSVCVAIGCRASTKLPAISAYFQLIRYS
jgi:hypothetical protein